MHRSAAFACATLLALGAALGASGKEGGQHLKPRLSGQALVEALAQGGYVVLMRHQATEEVAPDQEAFALEDCSTQRNLSEQGRQAAREIGEAFRALGIRVGQVLSSPYCRCLETGKLAFGRAEPLDLLATFDTLPALEKDERGAAIRKLLATPPPEPGTNTVLITHTGTLLYSFGLDTTPEGIAHVFRPGPVPGMSQYVGRVTPDEWSRLAGALSPPRP